MISTAEVASVTHFSISCVNGERGQVQAVLDIKRDNQILVFPKQPSFKVYKTRNQEVEARDFRDLDHIGIFYCESARESSPVETITMINNFERSGFGLCAAKYLFETLWLPANRARSSVPI